MGQARTRGARPAGLRSSSVAGPRPFAIRCRSTPQRTGYAVMHSSAIAQRGATSLVPCRECWETRCALAIMCLPTGRLNWKTVSMRTVDRRADERGMVRKHPRRTPCVRVVLASCGKGWEGPRVLPSWRRFGSVAPPSEAVMFCQPQVLSPSQCSKALTPAAGPCRGDKRHGRRPNSRVGCSIRCYNRPSSRRIQMVFYR